MGNTDSFNKTTHILSLLQCLQTQKLLEKEITRNVCSTSLGKENEVQQKLTY